MNYRRLLVIGFILLLGLDNLNRQDKDNPDNSINNNPDDDNENTNESTGMCFKIVQIIFTTENNI